MRWLLLAVVLAACAHPIPDSPASWTQRPTFNTDTYECEREARSLSRGFMTGYQGIYDRCMAARGYTK